jgi:hypothetical protein
MDIGEAGEEEHGEWSGVGVGGEVGVGVGVGVGVCYCCFDESKLQAHIAISFVLVAAKTKK